MAVPEVREVSEKFGEVLDLAEQLTRWMDESGYAGSFKVQQISTEVVDLMLFDGKGDIQDVVRRSMADISALAKEAVEMTRWYVDQEMKSKKGP